MLEQGLKSPDFTLPDQDNRKVRIADYKGQWVIVYFYPKAMTPGCTTETCNFQEALPEFEKNDAAVLGISKDSIEKQKKFAEKYKINFPLLSDAESDVCEQFGVWQKKSMYGKEYMGIVRSTFIIDPDGNIARVYPKVKVKEHHHEVMADLNALKK